MSFSEPRPLVPAGADFTRASPRMPTVSQASTGTGFAPCVRCQAVPAEAPAALSILSCVRPVWRPSWRFDSSAPWERRALPEPRRSPLLRARHQHRLPRRRPVDHHVTRACDRGRGVPDRSTLLADLATRRTCAMGGPRTRESPLRPSGTTDPLRMRTCALYGYSRAPPGAASTSGCRDDDLRRPRPRPPSPA